MLHTLEIRVRDLYASADLSVSRFQAQSGLRCPGGCTDCCNSEKVEATTLEMIPLAFHLCTTGQAELLIKRIERDPEQLRCVLFRPELAEPGGGGCSNYPFRALVCRLFGFAAVTDRTGLARLAHCRIMAAASPGTTAVRSMPEDAIPRFHDFGLAVTALHPGLGTRRKPINQAIYEAVLKVGLFLEMSSSADLQTPTDLPPEHPLAPLSTPRRAA